MFFGPNIKLLRKRRGRTQDEIAAALGLKRPTLSGYENGIAQPDLNTLIAFSQYYKVAIDTLIKIDLGQLPESQISQIEKGFDTFITGSQLRVLATTVDRDNRDNIELVGEKARAGYTQGFADPEFISVLPTFQLPFLHRERKYRAFQINGDSMHPIPDGSWVIGEFVQNWNFLRDKHAYIILTLDDGIVFKVVENRIPKEARLILHSLNPLYHPYEVAVKEVREIWKFVHFISSALPEPNSLDDTLVQTVKQLKQELKVIQMKLNL